MKEIITFLQQLSANNNKTWFNAHKEEFLALQAKFHGFVEELIHEISLFDPSIAGLTPKDCTYRIYRDTRFSADKTPYKTHMGAFICPKGKKSGYSGYYFHISTGDIGYPGAHMLATGDYCHSPEALQIIREDIAYGDGDFAHTLQQAAEGFTLDTDGALKRNPKGFPVDTPYAEYIRLKNFCICKELDSHFFEFEEANLAQRVATLFKTTKPFLDYINRAIAFSKGE